MKCDSAGEELAAPLTVRGPEHLTADSNFKQLFLAPSQLFVAQVPAAFMHVAAETDEEERRSL